MARRTRLVDTPSRRKAAPVRVERLGLGSLHPLARAAALRAAQGDASRIEVVSPTEAWVR